MFTIPMSISPAVGCSTTPLLNSVGTPTIAFAGFCPGSAPVQIQCVVNLSAALGGGFKLQYRWSTNGGSSYGSWADTASTGPAITVSTSQAGTTTANANGFTNYDFRLEARIVPDSESTVCRGPVDGGILNVNIYNC